MSVPFQDRVAIVTGGASGIGAASVRRLRDEGARVVVVDIAGAAGAALADEVGARFVKMDVSEPGAWTRLVVDCEADFGGIDYAHLNAGILSSAEAVPFLETPVSRYRKVVGVNLDGVAFGIHALAPAIERRGGGAIVATASLAGLIPYGDDPIYAATKHAIVGLVRSVAPQLRRSGVRLNAICPGGVETPLVGELRKQRIVDDGRPMLDPSEVAAAVVTQMSSGVAGLVQTIVHGHGVKSVPPPSLP